MSTTRPAGGPGAALPVARDPLLDAVDLHGAHDFRHTYATWLEDAGIPARVIDELMGHEASGRGQHLGSAMGAHYRHTTQEMAARVVEAIQQRLEIVLEVAEQTLEDNSNQSTLRVFWQAHHRELGKHLRTARYGLILQVGGHGRDRGCPWMTAVDRCVGHVGGTAGENESVRCGVRRISVAAEGQAGRRLL
jgi:hypothetical protein